MPATPSIVARLDGETVVVRRSRRSPDALDWELDLLEFLARHDFVVPTARPTTSGRRHVDGMVVTRWIDGRAPTGEDDWNAVADQLDRLHRLTAGWAQRPGFRSARQLLTEPRGGDVDLSSMPRSAVQRVRAAWASLPDVADVVVHGDPGPGNIRIGDDGRIGLLDWDEARVDSAWFDLADLPIRRLPPDSVTVAAAAAHAWEAANGWNIEPNYARWRLELLDAYRAGRPCPARPS